MRIENLLTVLIVLMGVCGEVSGDLVAHYEFEGDGSGVGVASGVAVAGLVGVIGGEVVDFEVGVAVVNLAMTKVGVRVGGLKAESTSSDPQASRLMTNDKMVRLIITRFFCITASVSSSILASY